MKDSILRKVDILKLFNRLRYEFKVLSIILILNISMLRFNLTYRCLRFPWLLTCTLRSSSISIATTIVACSSWLIIIIICSHTIHWGAICGIMIYNILSVLSIICILIKQINIIRIHNKHIHIAIIRNGNILHTILAVIVIIIITSFHISKHSTTTTLIFKILVIIIILR